jgi:DNA-binding response OmpR family regulator
MRYCRPFFGLVPRNRATTTLQFAGFKLDLAAERLWKDGTEVRLRRKPFEILRYLALNPGRLVTQAEVIEASGEISP